MGLASGPERPPSPRPLATGDAAPGCLGARGRQGRGGIGRRPSAVVRREGPQPGKCATARPQGSGDSEAGCHRRPAGRCCTSLTAAPWHRPRRQPAAVAKRIALPCQGVLRFPTPAGIAVRRGVRYRRGWDSNPRNPKVHRFSRPARSAALAPLQAARPDQRTGILRRGALGGKAPAGESRKVPLWRRKRRRTMRGDERGVRRDSPATDGRRMR